MDFPYYPINDFGPAMKGMVIGGMGILHVYLAQFAIGGGMLLCYFQWAAQTGRIPLARRFLDSYFQFLVLLSFVLGALTGVGMWFVSIQVSPRTIGMMVDHFHWLWAVEWTFFFLEIVTGYLFYRYGKQLSDPVRMKLLVLYSSAAWFSLFWINGILAWQLTPGEWIESHSIWDGFFNPSFWPSLIFRTIVALTIATLVSLVVINTMEDVPRRERSVLIHQVAYFLSPMAFMPVVAFWYFLIIPEDSRSWVMGGSVAMTMFMFISVAASLLIGLYVFFGLIIKRFYINTASALMLCALAFGATAGGEFVREGIRKPYSIRQTLYSNSITHEEIGALRENGSVTADPYPLRHPEKYPNDQLRLGAKVYRLQCSICHTMDAANGLSHLTGSWTLIQKRMNISMLQHTKSFMPPFAGNAQELEALVQMIEWANAGQPSEWTDSADAAVFTQIGEWLEEAGTAPGSSKKHLKRKETH